MNEIRPTLISKTKTKFAMKIYKTALAISLFLSVTTSFANADKDKTLKPENPHSLFSTNRMVERPDSDLMLESWMRDPAYLTIPGFDASDPELLIEKWMAKPLFIFCTSHNEKGMDCDSFLNEISDPELPIEKWMTLPL